MVLSNQSVSMQLRIQLFAKKLCYKNYKKLRLENGFLSKITFYCKMFDFLQSKSVEFLRLLPNFAALTIWIAD